MVDADVEPAATAILADDWGDRRAWFTFAVRSPGCRVVVAEADDRSLIGTGVASVHGRVGWVGTIWVASGWRGQGLGRRLTEWTIDAAEDAGCRTLVLVATSSGRPLYERLGFEVQTWYRTMERPGVAPAPDTAGAAGAAGVRDFADGDLDAMLALDTAATGEDRRHAIEAFAAPGSTRVATGPGGAVTGFVIRAPWGGGATIAPALPDALAILDARLAAAGPGRTVRCGILIDNESGAETLEATDWTEAWRAPRLVRGEPLDWDPSAIWGQFNHALG